MQPTPKLQTAGVLLGLLLVLTFLVGCSPGPTQLPSAPAPVNLPSPVQSTFPPQTAPLPPKLPVLFDDDGSPDGTAALLYLLSNPAVAVKAVPISQGEAHPQIYIQHMGRILESFGITGIPLGAGSDSALVPGEGFPAWLRASSDNFWDLPLPNSDKKYPTQDAAELMVSLLKQAPEPMTVFISGSNTDLARALRLDPGIREHIKAIYIMGGAVNVPGNLTNFPKANPLNNVSSEWNIYLDPLAASEVFESGLPITLVPLDATNQVKVSMKDTALWRTGGKPAIFAADIFDSRINSFGEEQFGSWDLMTAEIMLHPELCPTVPQRLKVITEQGKTYGQTLAQADGQPNVQVCLKPDVPAIKRTLNEEFAVSH
jgi:pyrimidine-specific ribonucleoside hydrolase